MRGRCRHFLRRPSRRRLPSSTVAFALIACAALGGGCDGTAQEISRLRQRNAAQERRINVLERDLVSLQEELKTRKAQVDRLQRLGVRRLEMLNRPVRIEIDRMTGGYDDDGRPGDDGVIVYLRPVDATGDVVKATGEVEIQLWDLEGRADELLLGQYMFEPQHALKNWYGRFLTHHYSLKCPWREEPPPNPEVTVKVRFVDYVTGEVLTAQAVCEVTTRGTLFRDEPE